MKAIKIPFSFVGGKTNSTSQTSTIVNQKIENVLNTVKSSRILNPTYGSSITKLINEYPDELTLMDAKVEAISDLSDGISNVTILDMRFDADSLSAEDPALNVYLSYRLPIGTILGGKVKIAIPGIVTEDTIV